MRWISQHRDLRLSNWRRRGAAMIVALMTVGIMSFAIGAILLAVREFNRLANDKVAYEEAYHAALGGVTAAKA